MPEVMQNEAIERLIRIAFNKENPSDLLMQLVKVLGKAGLKDEASRVKSMSKSLQQAWSDRDKAASMLREALDPQHSPTSARIAKLAEEVRTMQASLDKQAFESPKKFKLHAGQIFSSNRQLGSESIDRVRAQTEAAKIASEALTNMDRVMFGNLGAVGEMPAEAVSNVRRWAIRNGRGLADEDHKELEKFVREEAKKRFKDRMKMVEDEFKKYASDRTATDKTAMSMGKEIFQALVDIKKMYAARKMADEQTGKLLRDIMGKLMDELEPRNRGVQRAINRLNNAISRPTTPENLRNQIFKVADELGMRLPSSSF